jgi:hypothetical protein
MEGSAMSPVHLTKAFTTDEREGDTVSIALALSDDPDEMWRRSFNRWITDLDWLADNDGVILGYSFPFSYDGTNSIEIRTHAGTIDQALDAVATTIAKVNVERAESSDHNSKTSGAAEHVVQAWFDRR